jgi:hypothetical protein
MPTTGLGYPDKSAPATIAINTAGGTAHLPPHPAGSLPTADAAADHHCNGDVPYTRWWPAELPRSCRVPDGGPASLSLRCYPWDAVPSCSRERHGRPTSIAWVRIERLGAFARAQHCA